MDRIRHVHQRTVSSCGLACIAMLMGRPVGRVRRVLKSRLAEYDGDCTDVADLRFALRRLGARLGRKVRSSSWKRLAQRHTRALAAVSYREHKDGTARWHWVVFDGTWLEPAVWDPRRRKGPRTDLGALPLAWYHPVTVGR